MPTLGLHLRKLRELRNERDFLRDQLRRCDRGRRRVSQEAKEREELLARRHAVSGTPSRT